MSDVVTVEDSQAGEATALETFMQTGLEVETDDIRESLEDGEATALEDREATASEEDETLPATEETGSAESDDDDSKEPDVGDDSTSKGKEAPTQQKHKTGAARFGEVTAQRYKAEARADEAEKKYQATLAELNQLKNPKAPAGKQPKPSIMPKMPTKESVDFDDTRYAEAMDQYQQSMEAYRDYRQEERILTREAVQAKRAADVAHKESSEAIENGFYALQDAYKDAKGPDGKLLRPDYEQVCFSNLTVQPAVEQAIKESEHGPELLYHIAKNPALADKLLSMSPSRAIMVLGSIDVKGKMASAKQRKGVSSAPEPIDSLGGAGRSGVYSNVETMPIAEFMKQREKEYYG